MKVLVIPDVHLKPWMFEQAAVLMRAKQADRAVCLMDIPDDWGKEYDIALYEQTYDAAIDFAKEFPETAWCYGNHDLSYLWHRLESGYSSMAAYTVQRKLLDLRDTLTENNPICYVQKIDNVLFSHAGVLDYFAESVVPKAKYHDVEAVVAAINELGPNEMWNDASPIWIRPQHSNMRLYKPRKLLQVAYTEINPLWAVVPFVLSIYHFEKNNSSIFRRRIIVFFYWRKHMLKIMGKAQASGRNYGQKIISNLHF